MSRFNTGNPIGSGDVKDLSDNAKNLDLAVNSVSDQTWRDRFGKTRKTLYGVEVDGSNAITLFQQEAAQSLQESKDAADRVIANLGFFVPVPYAVGLNVETPNFTVTHEGVIYAAQAGQVPFTTGEWDASQWYPLQNTKNNNAVLYFASNAEAVAASAVLPDGQIVIAPDANGERSRYIVQNGSLVFQESIDYSGEDGASLIGYTPKGVGAIPTNIQGVLDWNSVNVFRFMTPEQIIDVQSGAATLDATLPFATAVACLVAMGGGNLIAPRGTYLLNGSTGLDEYKNGILLPDTGGDFSTQAGINIIGEGVDTVFRAGSPNMIVLRHSRLYSGGNSFRIEGAGLANVIGIAVAPESLTQTTKLVSQSYAIYREVYVENCTEGLLLQPGPTVAGADSGCFYHKFYDINFNSNTRHVWMKKDVTNASNRTTRTVFYSPIFARGNTGVQIDGGTEIDFYAPSFEMINSGTSPSTIPTAFIYNDDNPANIHIYGGYAEACTKALVSINPEYVQLFAFTHTSIRDVSEYEMGSHNFGNIVVSKVGNNEVRHSFGSADFISFVADPGQNGSRDFELQFNQVRKERWDADGSKTFYGSLGNIKFDSSGASITFSRAGYNTLYAPVGATFDHRAATHSWSSPTGVNWVTMNAEEFIPRIDNSTSFGINGLRWASIWAANGTIQTSDPRTKKDIVESPLGLDFILSLKPKAYRFKVGGNKIVGEKEVKPAVLDEEGNIIDHAVVEPLLEAVPGKRQHFGFMTTDVKAAAGDVDFGGYIKTDLSDPDSEEALRYEEFIAPMVKAIQELAQEVATLKTELKAIKTLK